MSEKKFGLIIPKKADKFKIQASSVFGEESDEDDKQSNRPKIPQKKMQLKSKIKQESLEDPSIYEYDSIYDEMKATEAESIAPKEKKNSRYIETLLKAADKRKKEYERRIDKKIQVERENEGDMYKDKEAFVTSSYKKKLQEKEEEEERERRENMLNDMMDVTKQKDLSGFYRHFLKQSVGEEKIPPFGARDIKKEPCEEGADDDGTGKLDLGNIDQDSDGVEIDSESDESDTKYKKPASIKDIPRKGDDSDGKNRRRKTNENEDLSHRSKYLPQRKKHKTDHKRANSASSSDSLSTDEDIVSSEKSPHSSKTSRRHRSDHDSSSDSGKVNKSHKKERPEKSKNRISSADGQTNEEKLKPYKNTKFSSSSDSESDVNEDALRAKKSSDSNKKAPKNHSRHDSSSSSDADDDDDVDNEKEKQSKEQTNENETAKKSKLKKNIYTKRTVGEIFISAQARYFQRMALKA